MNKQSSEPLAYSPLFWGPGTQSGPPPPGWQVTQPLELLPTASQEAEAEPRLEARSSALGRCVPAGIFPTAPNASSVACLLLAPLSVTLTLFCLQQWCPGICLFNRQPRGVQCFCSFGHTFRDTAVNQIASVVI